MKFRVKRETLEETLKRIKNKNMNNPRGPMEEAVIKILKEEFNDIVDVQKLNSVIDSKIGDVKSYLENHLHNIRKELKESSSLNSSTREIKVELIRPGESTIKEELGPQHQEFPTLLKMMSIKQNVYIYGPTGSGKSQAAIIAGERVMKIPVYVQAVYPQAPTSLLMGYNTASGSYCEGIAYKPYCEGGILLIDELDNAALFVEDPRNRIGCVAFGGNPFVPVVVRVG